MNWKIWQRNSNVTAGSSGSILGSFGNIDVSTIGNILGVTGKVAGGLIGAYLLISIGFAWWWDFEPDMFDVRASAIAHAETKNHELVTGYITTATLIRISETMLEKRGGYLSNDVFPPGIWMDNVPNWEFGVLTHIRDTARAFRNEFSRSQSQSTEDPDLSIAEGKFFFDNSSWVFPQSEDEYREGIGYFDAYLDRLPALERMDWGLVEAGRDLYASGSKAFRKITLPLSKPGIIAGSILVFIPSLGAYVTPDILGGAKTNLLGNLIVTQFSAARNWPFGSALSGAILIIMLVATLLFFRTGERTI